MGGDEKIITKISLVAKTAFLKIWKPALLISLIISITTLFTASSWYTIIESDVRENPDDKTNAPAAIREYIENVDFSSDKTKLVRARSIQEFWNDLKKNGNRLLNYISSPKELSKIVNAVMTTSYPDLRDSVEEDIDWDDINKNTGTDDDEDDESVREVQGIIKFKRSLVGNTIDLFDENERIDEDGDGTISEQENSIYMTYVDPDTFQSYINEFNSTASSTAKKNALSHFTLKKEYVKDDSENLASLENVLFIGDSIIGACKSKIVEEGGTVLYQESASANFFLGNATKPSGNGNCLINEENKFDWEENFKNRQPSAIFLLIGHNSVGQTSDIKILAEKLAEKFPNKKIYISSVLPVGDKYNSVYMTKDTYNQKQQEMNNDLKSYCSENSHFTYIDILDNYAEKVDTLTSDGLHPNADGASILIKNIKQKLGVEEVGTALSEENVRNMFDNTPVYSYEELESMANQLYGMDDDCFAVAFGWAVREGYDCGSDKFLGYLNDCVGINHFMHGASNAVSLANSIAGGDGTYTARNLISYANNAKADESRYSDNYKGMYLALISPNREVWFCSGRKLNPSAVVVYESNIYSGGDQIVASHPSNESQYNWVRDIGTTSQEKMLWPSYTTTITSGYGGRNQPTSGASTYHEGVDIGASNQSEIWAANSGTVDLAGWNGGYGNCVIINHGNGYKTVYGHMSSVGVSVGENVTRGQVIGYVGSTGISTGPHIHFEVREYTGDSYITYNPLEFAYENGPEGTEDGIYIGSSIIGGSENYEFVVKVATWNASCESTTLDGTLISGSTSLKYTMTTKTIKYKEYIDPYGIPFNYLWTLLVLSEDNDFISDLADLVYNSRIEITIHDNETTNTNIYTYRYTNKKVCDSIYANVHGTVTNEDGTENNYDSPVQLYNVFISSNSHIKQITTVTKTNTLDIALTLADVWCVKYSKKYQYKEPQEVASSDTGQVELENIEETGFSDSPLTGDEISAVLKNVPRYSGEGNLRTYVTSGYARYTIYTQNRTEQTQSSTIKASYTGQSGETQEKTDKYDSIFQRLTDNDPDDGKPNFVTELIANKKAKSNILNSTEILFYLLELNEDTVEMIDLTKYLLYKATGTDYGITEFDFESMFDPKKFMTISRGRSGIDGVPGQIYDFLLSKGVPPIGAAAVLGNIEHESSFKPEIINSIGAKGLCQWCGDRAPQLDNFAAENGGSWTDVDIQLKYLWYELENSYTNVLNVIMNASTEEDLEYATWYWGSYFEVYDLAKEYGFEATKNWSTEHLRYEYAQKWYKEWQEKHIEGSSIYGNIILDTCVDVMNKLIALNAHYGPYGGLTVPDRIQDLYDNHLCVCATYVSTVLYESGLIPADIINKYSFNQCGDIGIEGIVKEAGWTCVYDGRSSELNISILEPGDVIEIATSYHYRLHVMIYAGDGYIYDQQCAVVSSSGNPPTGDKRYALQTYLNDYRYFDVWRAP